MIQRDVESNWQKTVDEIANLGDRLPETAQQSTVIFSHRITILSLSLLQNTIKDAK